MKKILSLALALVLLFCMAAPVSAGITRIPGEAAAAEAEELSSKEVTKTVKTKNGSVKVTVMSHPQMAKEVLSLTNKEREKAGVPALSYDPELADAIMQRAVETTVNWSHTRPDGRKWFTVSEKVNAENIAKGQKDSETVMNRWMDSKDHKKNILSKKYTRIAVACVEADGEHYWIQLMGW